MDSLQSYLNESSILRNWLSNKHLRNMLLEFKNETDANVNILNFSSLNIPNEISCFYKGKESLESLGRQVNDLSEKEVSLQEKIKETNILIEKAKKQQKYMIIAGIIVALIIIIAIAIFVNK